MKNKNLDDFEIPLKGTRGADNQSAGTNTPLILPKIKQFFKNALLA